MKQTAVRNWFGNEFERELPALLARDESIMMYIDLGACNELCIELGGTPLLNQTDFLTRAQAEKVFGDRIAVFQRYRQRFDRDDRLLNPYFKGLLG